MKGKITRMRLDISEQSGPVVLGIACPDADYKLSLRLNQKLKISLRNSSPVEIEEAGGGKTIFSKFSHIDPAGHIAFYLISNRTGTNYLLRSMKNIDFIVLVYDQGGSINAGRLAARLREVENITGVFNLDDKTLKNKDLKLLRMLPEIGEPF
jgi:hypothetical protein